MFQLHPIRAPWSSFLRAVDKQLSERSEIHCIGGFALSLFIENTRPTGDIDFVDVIPSAGIASLLEHAGENSILARRYRLQIERVGVVDTPDEYETRLIRSAQPAFRNLTIAVLDPYDLILTKLQRNSPRDREDIGALIAALPIDGKALADRYRTTLEPYLAVAPERTTLTLELLLAEHFPNLPN